MKTVSKVFIIISIVFASIATACGVFFILESLTSSGAGYDNTAVMTQGLSLLIVGIIVLIVGSIALKKIKKATSHSQLIGIGVCTLLFCSFLGGIFMLLIKDEELKNN